MSAAGVEAVSARVSGAAGNTVMRGATAGGASWGGAGASALGGKVGVVAASIGLPGTNALVGRMETGDSSALAGVAPGLIDTVVTARSRDFVPGFSAGLPADLAAGLAADLAAGLAAGALATAFWSFFLSLSSAGLAVLSAGAAAGVDPAACAAVLDSGFLTGGFF